MACLLILWPMYKRNSLVLLAHSTDIIGIVTLHQYYSGVLAGMWPCGIVGILTELFTAESTSVSTCSHT